MLAGGGCWPWFSSASARACALPAESNSTSLLAADETGRSVALAGAVETRELERLVPIVLQGEGEGTPRVKT